ncbi:basic phospholipase A2 Ts-G6D49-like [Hemicordylus capensis]|uniref:basic phospholipase A2 Ts-G6D49-like n=1 Tax=Hemicordylus capensis TaxID=884348 RepID=UPI0023034464|nr:basic phospholipase A2 Ts-G6D49-like [Hemicordylus capensis]
MKSFMEVTTLIACSVLVAQANFIQFGHMIKELTGKNALPDYTSYGCYCGVGGRGEPRDATDRCCFAHDCCYKRLSNCRTTTDRYQYDIENGTVICGEGSWCKMEICDCDKTAALCFRDNLDTYSDHYRFYSNLNCNEKPPRC